MELGEGASVPLATWIAVAAAVGGDLTFEIVTAEPRSPVIDGTARRCHRLVADLALRGSWATWTEIHEADPTSSETMLLRPDRLEVAIVRVWDVIAVVPAAIESFDRRLERERVDRGPKWKVGGAVVVPSTGENRRRLTEEEGLVGRAFPERGAEWLIALRHARPMPPQPGMIWTDQRLERLRPMLPYLDRRRRDRDRARHPARHRSTGRAVDRPLGRPREPAD